MKPIIDEIQLTAYALGELSASERRQIEVQLKANPAQQAAVDEIRALAAQLESELKCEPAIALTDEQRQAILKAPAGGAGELVRFPWRKLSGFAAVAAILVFAFIGLFRGTSRSLDQQRAAGQKEQRIEVAMLPAPPDAPREREPAAELTVAGSPERVEPAPNKPDDITKSEDQLVEELATAAQEPRPVADSDKSGDQRLNGQYPVDSKPTATEIEGSEELPPPVDFAAAPPQRLKELSELTMASDSVSPLIMKNLSPGTMANRSGAGRQASIRNYGGAWAPYPSDQRMSPDNTESYAPIQGNAFKSIAAEPLSTFSIDVDTASYANIRRFLRAGQMPPPDAVRIEEMVNYFTYDYAPPKEDVPFAVHVESAACPWNKAHQLVKIGLKGKELDVESRSPCNLVFLIDVSGSMNSDNKLPLVKKALQLLAKQLSPQDRVSIAVYASASGLVLPSTAGNDLAVLSAAIENLQAGGSTAGGAGIRLAYDEALKNFQAEGNNRVVLCTDGDFNVGITDSGELAAFIAERAKKGIFLTVLGFGMGNYKDDRLETLADKGNGNYAYIDNFSEARKNLSEQAVGTLFTIAKDVKLQIEFNPAHFDSYRLIGYENRVLAKEDFNNDKKDAGELGAGHTVTAFYELVPAGVESAPGVDPLKYKAQDDQPAAEEAVPEKSAKASPEWLTVKLRYKLPKEDRSTKIEIPYLGIFAPFENASDDFRFAAGVAAGGFLMRQDAATSALTFGDVIQWTSAATGADPNGYRREFIQLLQDASALAP